LLSFQTILSFFSYHHFKETNNPPFIFIPDKKQRIIDHPLFFYVFYHIIQSGVCAMKKYPVTVKTIKYKEYQIPAVVTVDRKSYFISEVKKEKHHFVFPGGGVGTKYTVVINKKEKYIFQDKHTQEWHIYHEAKRTEVHA